MTRARANQSRRVLGRRPNAYGAIPQVTNRTRNQVVKERMENQRRRLCFTAFSMLGTASGVVQVVSPWSTSTLPMRLAAAMAFLCSDGLKTPIEMSAPFIA